MPYVRVGGENPKSNGGSPATLTVPFEVLDGGTADEPLTVRYASFAAIP